MGTLNTFYRMADLPTERGFMMCFVIDNKGYVVGGSNVWPDNSAGFTCYASNEVYNPVDNTWSTAAPLPTARGAGVGFAINGKGYVVGGYDGTSVLGTNEEYDPATDTWTTKAPMPTARKRCTCFVIDSIAYVVGGEDATDTPLGTTESYNPATDTWTTCAAMPTPRADLEGFELGGRGHAVCGRDAVSVLATHEEYDPTTDTWTAKSAVTINNTERPLFQGTCIQTSGRVMIGGGQTSLSSDAGNSSLFEYDTATDSWSLVTDIPRIRPAGLKCFTCYDIAFLVGGGYTSGTIRVGSMNFAFFASVTTASGQVQDGAGNAMANQRVIGISKWFKNMAFVTTSDTSGNFTVEIGGSAVGLPEDKMTVFVWPDDATLSGDIEVNL